MLHRLPADGQRRHRHTLPRMKCSVQGMGIHKGHPLRKRGLASLVNAYWAALAAALVTLPNADWAYIRTICRTALHPWFDRDRCLLSTYKADDRCIPPGCHLCHSAHSVFLREGHRWWECLSLKRPVEARSERTRQCRRPSLEYQE